MVSSAPPPFVDEDVAAGSVEEGPMAEAVDEEEDMQVPKVRKGLERAETKNGYYWGLYGLRGVYVCLETLHSH